MRSLITDDRAQYHAAGATAFHQAMRREQDAGTVTMADADDHRTELPPTARLSRIQALRQRGRAITQRRRMLWTLIWLAMGAVATAVLLPDVGALRASVRSLETAQPAWLVVGLGLVVLRHVLAALTLTFAVGRPLPFGPTLLVQVSSSFVGRLPPEGMGWLVLNQRYLERAGIGRAAALAAMTLKVFVGLIMRLVITAAVVVAVGTSGVSILAVPGTWPYLLGIGIGVVVIGLILRTVFRPAASRAMAQVRAAATDLVRVFHEPPRAAALFGASAGLTLAYGLVLVVSVLAFGADVSPVEVLAVYLGGTAVASASPTPGNLGAMEVALSTGLTAVGVASAPAVAAVLLYRLLTFWLPIAPGFIAFRYLQVKRYI
jgi:glycosyltransferase 2 family protein